MGLITQQKLKNLTTHRKKYFSENKGLGTPYILKDSFNPKKTYDVFLSHSYMDKEDIASLKVYLENFGLTVYVDWIDDKILNRKSVNKKTALLIKNRMKNCKSLFYAFSENSSSSKWMPWELGYFDGFKGRVAILPISSKVSNHYVGTEYLGVYPYVSEGKTESTNKDALWICENETKYIILNKWLKGKELVNH